MNTRHASFRYNCSLLVVAAIFGGASFLMMGCASSEELVDDEVMEEAPVEKAPVVTIDPMLKRVDSLRAENSSLSSRVNKLEQDKRGLSAQVAELETKLAEARKRAEVKPPTPPPPMMTKDAKAEYDHALTLFKQRNYQEALSVWMGLLNTGAPEGLESNCHYWIGECYYGTRQYTDALTHFEHVFGYARTTKKDDAQLKIALCYERLGDKVRAKQEYQKLIDQYPVSPYLTKARERMARL